MSTRLPRNYADLDASDASDAYPDSIPAARVLSVSPTKYTRLVYIECPYCTKTHQHGWPYGHASIGHRNSHCPDGHRGGYVIATPIEGSPHA